MQLLQEIGVLIRKEIVLEWRQRYALNGMLLYIVSTVMVCYFGLGQNSAALNPPTWNTLFWIILLFTAVNAVAKSFGQERAGRLLYYYTLASPQGIILSKIVYNSLLLLLLAGVGYVIYSVVLGNPVEDNPLFVGNVLLGAVGFSSTLTMVLGHCHQSRQQQRTYGRAQLPGHHPDAGAADPGVKERDGRPRPGREQRRDHYAAGNQRHCAGRLLHPVPVPVAKLKF